MIGCPLALPIPHRPLPYSFERRAHPQAHAAREVKQKASIPISTAAASRWILLFGGNDRGPYPLPTGTAPFRFVHKEGMKRELCNLKMPIDPPE